MKSKPIRILLLPILWLALLLGSAQPAHAAPPPQSDPAEQCAQGVQLFLDEQPLEALPLLEAGFAGRANAAFASPEDEGLCALSLGLLRDKTGNRSGALAAYEVALEIFQASGNRDFEGRTLNNIGLVYDNQGRHNEALESYQAALTIFRQVGDRAGEGSTLNNIGEVYRNQGRFGQALDSYQAALAIRRQVGDRAGEGITLTNIGTVYRNQGRFGQALESYQQAIAIFEAVRATAGSETGRAGFIARYAFLYDNTMALLHQQKQDQEAFFTSERGRARAFLDSLATGQVQLGDNAAADLLAQEQAAYAQRQAIQDSLARAQALDPPDPDWVDELEAQLAEAEAAYNDVQAAIEARGDQLAALVPGRSTHQTILEVSEVQALLGEHTTLISYWMLDEEILAFLITPDSFQTIALEVSREELMTQIIAFRSFPNLSVAHPDSAVRLYGWLVEPLKPHLTTPHLTIVPHNVLHYLPFAALTDGERYLIDDYVLTTLPSASSLPFIQENSGSELRSPLILGNPVVEDSNLPPLAFAEREAQTIAETYGTQPLLGEAATERAVWDQASEAGILHLAAHGSYSATNPLNSKISLAPSGDGEDEQHDGKLEVRQIYGLDLHQTGLVVLSACETQLGELEVQLDETELMGVLSVTPGDEVVGLTRGFFFAGTPSVVASLWRVNDEATASLMESFYNHLREGLGKAEALRQAQLEVRAEYPNPFYWSAFVLSGEAGTIDQEGVFSQASGISTPAPASAPSSGWGWLVIGTGMVLVVIVSLVLWRRVRKA